MYLCDDEDKEMLKWILTFNIKRKYCNLEYFRPRGYAESLRLMCVRIQKSGFYNYVCP
ncbi:unnamed protein product, partial [Timema podura]|nr:unnamed protein product [Timema podura]